MVNHTPTTSDLPELAEETFYLCSERCVQQFDREHTGSATTGVSEAGNLRRIEFPVTGWREGEVLDHLDLEINGEVGSLRFAAGTGNHLSPEIWSRQPSDSFGRRRPGSHQFQRPSRRIVAGTSSERMMVASTSTATVMPTP